MVHLNSSVPTAALARKGVNEKCDRGETRVTEWVRHLSRVPKGERLTIVQGFVNLPGHCKLDY